MKAFIIYLSAVEHSRVSSQEVLSKLISYGIDAELFEGVPGDQAVELAKKQNRTAYPFGIKSRQLSNEEILELICPELRNSFIENYYGKLYQRMDIGDKISKITRPGAIGCFYSHYNLWRKCIELDEPILICEDDVKLYRSFPDVDWQDVLIVALGKQTYLDEPYIDYLENPTGTPKALRWRNYSMPGCVAYAIKPHAARALVKKYRHYFLPADNAINASVCEIEISNYQMGRTTLEEEGNRSSIKTKDW